MSEFKVYLVDYEYDGKLWSFDLPAKSWEDANARLASIMMAHVAGELVCTIPACGGFLVRPLVYLMNFLCRLLNRFCRRSPAG